MFNKKGQLSIEVLIVLIFVISFIYVYNNLAEQTVYTLEVNKIKEQEQTIGTSLNEFLMAQRNVLYDTDITDYNATYKIQKPAIASGRINYCFVDINLTAHRIIVQTDYSNVFTTINTSLKDSDFNFPRSQIPCGDVILCKIKYGKIECNQHDQN